VAKRLGRLATLLAASAAAGVTVCGCADGWDQVVAVSKTRPTLQVVVNPPLRRGSPIHDPVFASLRGLGAELVRFVPWQPYPRLGVAELEPPANGQTSWDFSLIDPMVIDFLDATGGHEVILDFSTIPEWMFATAQPVGYPADPDQVMWDYQQGSELVDPSGQQVAAYFARVVAWYTQGGFTDELGVRHSSGHHYDLPYWEVLNEPEQEHHLTKEAYTRIYDAVVAAIRKVAPRTRFVGPALTTPLQDPAFLEYFLDHQHHQAGTPIDLVSYHFYAFPSTGEGPEAQQASFFSQADRFLALVRDLEQARTRLSPETRTTVDKIGAFSADDAVQSQPGHVAQPIADRWWNLNGVLYAYVFGELTRLGIDAAGASQLVGYPTQFPSVSMVDWQSGRPNARFRVLELLHDHFGPADQVVAFRPFDPGLASQLYALAVVTPDRKRRLLLVNKQDRPLEVAVPGGAGGLLAYVDQTTASDPAATRVLASDQVALAGLAVAVLTLR